MIKVWHYHFSHFFSDDTWLPRWPNIVNGSKVINWINWLFSLSLSPASLIIQQKNTRNKKTQVKAEQCLCSQYLYIVLQPWQSRDISTYVMLLWPNSGVHFQDHGFSSSSFSSLLFLPCYLGYWTGPTKWPLLVRFLPGVVALVEVNLNQCQGVLSQPTVWRIIKFIIKNYVSQWKWLSASDSYRERKT